MKLNQDRLLKTLNEKWEGRSCPYCNNNHWDISPKMMTLAAITEEKRINIGGKMLPLIPVTCSNCGNTVLVNAIVLDVIDEKEKGTLNEDE